jgi:predicted nuclease of predicted toxin-antitoxin system
MKFKELRILTDENISPRVLSFLRQQGMDIIDVKEQNWHGKTDKYLMEQAYLAQRFILTHDSDFGKLAIYEGQKYHGIVYLRLKNVKLNHVINVLKELLALEFEALSKTLIVVEDARIRIRQASEEQ